jgi:DUF438 domain-containing protein
MSPELEAALADDDARLALKRLFTYQRLRELNAPLSVIEKASSLLEESRRQLGKNFQILMATVYDEYKIVEDKNMEEQDKDFFLPVRGK